MDRSQDGNISSPVELSVLIPAYREAENLEVLLPGLVRICGELSPRHEIIVVDTMEPMDHTEKVCRIHGVRYRNRIGGDRYGDAIRSGIAACSGKHIVIMDADNSHDHSFIRRLFQSRDEADVVVASRYVPGGDTENSKVLIFMSWVLNVIYSVVLGIRCKDISNSFKLYDGEMLKSVRLKCSNFDVVEEILFKLKHRYPGLTIRELPYTFRRRRYGQTKRKLVAFMLTYIVTLVRLRLSVYGEQ